MSMWTAIVLIVIAAMAGEAWRVHVRGRSATPKQQELDALRQRLEALDGELRQRVETLEKIVTDDRSDLKRQFDELKRSG